MNQQRHGLVLAGLAALVAVTLVLVVMAYRHGTTVVGAGAPAPTITAASPASSSTAGATSAPSATPSAIAVVGGAMNYANSGSDTQPGSRSWLAYADPQLRKTLFVRDGLTSAAATALITGGPFATLIISTADDDVAAGRTATQSVQDMAKLVAKTKTSGDAVTVVPLSPATSVPAAQIRAFNTQLEQAVKAKGWKYCDAWAPVRAADGQWKTDADSALNGRGVSRSGARQVAAAVKECLAA